MNKNQKSKKIISLVVIFMVLFFTFYPALQTQAAALTAVSDTMSRMKDTTLSDHTIKFTTSAGRSAIGDTITITFPTGFTIGSVAFGDIDLSNGATTGYETEQTLAAAAGLGVWGASFTGQVLTLTHPTDATGHIAATNKVVVEIGDNATGGAGNNQITNQTVAQNNTDSTIEIAGNNSFDTGSFAVEIVANDQVTVSASVDPSITFSLSANATDFGVLAPAVVDTATTNITLTIGTNAANGYKIYANDAGNGTNPGLARTVPSAAIIGSADSSYNTTYDLDGAGAGYGIYTVDTETDADIAADYDHTDVSNEVGGLTITQKQYAEYVTGMTADHTIVVKHKAKAATFTGAGAYTDTITWVATANF